MKSGIFVIILTACFLKVMAEKKWYCENFDVQKTKHLPEEYPEELRCDWKDSMIEKFTSSICMTGMAEFFGPDPFHRAPDCYNKIHDDFMNFVNNFTQNVSALHQEIRNEGPKKYDKMIRLVMSSLHNVVNALLELKYKIRPAVIKKEYTVIPELINNCTIDMTKSQKDFFLSTHYLRPADDMYVEKGVNGFKKLREEQRKESQKILHNFETCINSIIGF